MSETDNTQTDQRLDRYASAIWTTSRADEGTISATGAKIVARAVIDVADAEQADKDHRLTEAERKLRTLEDGRSRTLGQAAIWLEQAAEASGHYTDGCSEDYADGFDAAVSLVSGWANQQDPA